MSSSIQTRVLALVGAGVFAAGALLSLLSRSSLLALEEEVRSEHTRLAMVAAGGLSAALRDHQQLLARATSAPRLDLSDDTDVPERLALDSVFHHGRLWSSVAFVAGDGRVIAVEPAADVGAFVAAEANAVLVQAAADQRPVVSDLIRGGDGVDRILLVVPFRSSEGRPAGVAAAAITIPSRRLDETLQGEHFGHGMRVELVDGAERQVASTGNSIREVHEGLRASAAVPGTLWSLRVVNVGPDPLAPIGAFRRRSLWLAPSMSVLAMLLGWGIARSVRRPLVGLTASAERISRGDLVQSIDTNDSRSAGDEIVRLATALETMRTSLKASIEETERANRDLEQRVADRTGELAALNAHLEERERLRQQLLRRVISAQEDERKRVARELHDETSQTLAAMGMGVDMALATNPPADTRQRLLDLRRLVDRMYQELHRLIVNLRPSVLDLGLAAAIEWFAERHLGAAGIGVRCELSELNRRLPTEIETAVFRAVQEAIVNISRHARADAVLIQGVAEGDVLTVEIEDDGVGFDVGRAADGPGSLRGVGLLGMQERMEILGGTLVVDSAPGRGTRVLMQCRLQTADCRLADLSIGE